MTSCNVHKKNWLDLLEFLKETNAAPSTTVIPLATAICYWCSSCVTSAYALANVSKGSVFKMYDRTTILYWSFKPIRNWWTFSFSLLATKAFVAPNVHSGSYAYDYVHPEGPSVWCSRRQQIGLSATYWLYPSSIGVLAERCLLKDICTDQSKHLLLCQKKQY